MDVLFWSSASYSSLPLMTLMTGSTDTDVNNAMMSQEMMHSPSSNAMFLTCFTKSFVFLMGRDLQISSLRILASSLAILKVAIFLLDTVGLKGMSFL